MLYQWSKSAMAHTKKHILNLYRSTYLTLPDGQAITSTKWYGDFPLLSFCTRFWMLRKPYVDAKHSTATPSFSRVVSWKSLFL